jgi:uncharacterized protein YcbX
MTSSFASLTRIARFPVKGLSAQPLEQAQLTPDQPIAGDRRFALAHGASAFDPAQPRWEKKANFLTWVRNPKIAALHCAFDPSGTRITVADPEPETSDDGIDNADLTTPEGRAALARLVAFLLDEKETRGKVEVVEAPETWFSDVPQPFLSIQNTASMADLGKHLGPTHGNAPVDWRRFRANLLIDGFPAWAERDWIGKRLRIGEAVLQVEELIGRCAATHVNPDTAEVDTDIVGTLRAHYGSHHCGVYARVVAGGMIRLNDRVSLV